MLQLYFTLVSVFIFLALIHVAECIMKFDKDQTYSEPRISTQVVDNETEGTNLNYFYDVNFIPLFENKVLVFILVLARKLWPPTS